jgi:hypothetical protein
VASEAIGAYLQQHGGARAALPASGGTALFAFGGEVIRRPSATGGYIVPDLEVEMEAHDLVESLGTQRVRPLRIELNAERGQLTVSILVPEEVAEQVLLGLRQASSGIWSLGELGKRLPHVGSFEQWLKAAPSISEGIDVTSKSIADATESLTLPAPPETTVSEEPAEAKPLVPLPGDASVEQITTHLSQLTGLSDGELGQLFPGEVSREHYQRWRTGRADNPTSANRRRMWFLVRLFERAALAGVATDQWVRNTTEIDELTPFELLRLGRFDEVEHLAARLVPAPEPVEITSAEGRPVILEQGPPSFIPRSEEPTSDLVPEEEEGWIEIEDDVDDE